MTSRTQPLPQQVPRASRAQAPRKPGDGYVVGVLVALVALASIGLLHASPQRLAAAGVTAALAARAPAGQCVAPEHSDPGLWSMLRGEGCDAAADSAPPCPQPEAMSAEPAIAHLTGASAPVQAPVSDLRDHR